MPPRALTAAFVAAALAALRGQERPPSLSIAAPERVVDALQVAPSGGPQQTRTGTGLVVGRVLDPDGRPIGGVIVSLGSRRVLTGTQGRFVFRDVPDGSSVLTSFKPGWADGAYGRVRPAGLSLPLELTEGERVGDVTLTMWRFAALSGTVRDEHGDPIAGIVVRALQKTFRPSEARWTTASSTTTDDRGMYRLGNLAPGDFTVVVPSTQTSYPVAQGPAGTAGFFAGAAAAGVSTITMAPALATGQAADRTLVIGDDQTILSGVPVAPGRERGQAFAYRTTFYPNALTSSQATSMALGSGEERTGVDFDLAPVPTVTIAGTVLGAGGPAPSATLTLSRAAPGPSGRIASISDIPVATAIADALGRFTFPAVPGGQLVLSAQVTSRPTPGAATQEPRTMWGRIPLFVDDRDVPDLVVSLSDGFTVSGHVEFEGTMPRPPFQGAASFNVEPLDARDGDSKGSSLSPDGRFSVRGLRPSDYYLRVTAPNPWYLKSVTWNGRDVADRPLEIDRDITNVVATFTDRPADIHGRVTDNNAPDPMASVIVFPADGVPLTELGTMSRRTRIVRADKGGAYRFAALPLGDYFVIAVPEAVTASWSDGAFLARISQGASRVHVNDGEKVVADLRTVRVQP